MNDERLLERFLRYVKIDTTAREGADGYPSSPGQLELGRLLVEELQAMGIDDARQDEHGIVTGHACRRPSDRHGADDRLLRPPGHLAGDDRRRTSSRRWSSDYRGGDLSLPGDREPGHPRRREPRAASSSSAAPSSPATARRCWAPTTRRAWP